MRELQNLKEKREAKDFVSVGECVREMRGLMCVSVK